ncbi:MAG TPA: hypothetical protein VNG12_04890 [Acidimicrobiales bacterium]|nr:hypothetical protein [Acidimicrobiales bacterium]
MNDEPITAATIATEIRSALEAADLSTYASLLAPDVTWGAPGDPEPACRNRGQVLAWYSRGRDAGTTARVTEVTVLDDDKILVGLMVKRDGEYAERWQILTVGQVGVADIRGFEDRPSATAFARV